MNVNALDINTVIVVVLTISVIYNTVISTLAYFYKKDIEKSDQLIAEQDVTIMRLNSLNTNIKSKLTVSETKYSLALHERDDFCVKFSNLEKGYESVCEINAKYLHSLKMHENFEAILIRAYIDKLLNEIKAARSYATLDRIVQESNDVIDDMINTGVRYTVSQNQSISLSEHFKGIKNPNLNKLEKIAKSGPANLFTV